MPVFIHAKKSLHLCSSDDAVQLPPQSLFTHPVINLFQVIPALYFPLFSFPKICSPYYVPSGTFLPHDGFNQLHLPLPGYHLTVPEGTFL